MRFMLLLITNFAIVFLVGAVCSLLGLEPYIEEYGGMNLQWLLLLCSAFGFGGALISLLMSKYMAKKMTGARVISAEPSGNAQEALLLQQVQMLANKAKLPMPEVAIFESDEPNAFATGATRNRALVAVSTGLLKHMERDEVEAVLAHEISHIANGDMVTLTLIQGVMNTFVYFLAYVIAGAINRIVFRSSGRGSRFYLVITLQMFFGIFAGMVVMWFSRRREFKADRGGADLAGRHKMIAALRKLQQAYDPATESLPSQMSVLGVSGKFKGLLSSHPPLAMRIERLQNETTLR